MLSPARLTQVMMEVIFLMLGLLVVWLGASGRIYFDRRGVPVLILSIALIAWGLLAFVAPSWPLGSVGKMEPRAFRSCCSALSCWL